MKTLRNAVDVLATVNTQALLAELDNLEAVRDWAMKQLGIDYRTGDRVVIVDDAPSDIYRGHGWWAYREALAPGQTGIAGEITFDRSRNRWCVLVGLDRAWSVSDQDHHGRNGRTQTITRYWHGPAAETPAGYVQPSRYEQEHRPDGQMVHFYMDVTWLAKASTARPGPQDDATGLVVRPYRNDHNQPRWAFRCWGTDTCDGWLSLEHSSQQSAERARDRHLTEAHPQDDE